MNFIEINTNAFDISGDEDQDVREYIGRRRDSILAKYNRVKEKIDLYTVGLLNYAENDFSVNGKWNIKPWASLSVMQYEDKHVEVILFVKLVRNGIHSIKNLTLRKIVEEHRIPYREVEVHEEVRNEDGEIEDVVHTETELDIMPILDLVHDSRVVAGIIKLVTSEYDETDNPIYNNVDFMEVMIEEEIALNHLDKLKIVDDATTIEFLNNLYGVMNKGLHDPNTQYTPRVGFVAFDHEYVNDKSYWGINIMNGTEEVTNKVYIHYGTYQLEKFLLLDEEGEIRNYCDKLAFSIVYRAMDDLSECMKSVEFVNYFEEVYNDTYDYMHEFIPSKFDLIRYSHSNSYDYYSNNRSEHDYRFDDLNHVNEFMYNLKTFLIPAMKATYRDFVEEEINIDEYYAAALNVAKETIDAAIEAHNNNG